MRLRGIVRFELACQLRRPWAWLVALALGAVAFLAARDDSLAEALHDDFFANSPFAVAKSTVVCGLLWLLMAPTIAGEAGARDVATRMHPLAWTTPVTRTEYLGGRFLAALLLNALLMVVVQAGILLGIYVPGLAPITIGPFRPEAFLGAFAFLSLPNVFAATAIQFALAVRTGRPTASYLGSVALLFTGYFVAGLLLWRKPLGKLLDPIGVRIVLDDLSHDWTTVEKRVRLLALEGPLLHNRLVWIGVGLAALAVTWLTFRFAHRVERAPWWRRALRRGAHAPTPALGAAPAAPIVVPAVPRAFGTGGEVRRTLAIARASFRAIASSWAGRALLVLIPLMAIPIVVQRVTGFGAPMIPATQQVLRELTAPLTAELSPWVIVPLLVAFFAGELVWRERDARVGEITDAMPGSEWPPLLGKFLGLGLVLVAFLTMLMAAGMAAQLLLGHVDFEPGLYLTVLFGLQLPEYLLFAMLALAVHVLVDHKYVGHVAVMAVYTVIVLAPLFGVEHDLLIYGAGPAWSYTTMRGFGASLAPWLWFKLYWAAWAVLLAVAGRLLWVRGREGRLATRLAVARGRLGGATLRAAAVAAVLVLGLGGFVFYNTNVLNRWRSSTAEASRRAEYERRYARYAAVAQPRTAGLSLRVVLQPARRAATIGGSQRLVNDGAAPIDTIHVATVPGDDTRALAFDRPATLVRDDAEHGHRIYALARPLAPRDTLRLDFEVGIAPRGFREDGVDEEISPDATFLAAWRRVPAIGYQASRELSLATDRRDHGLAPRPEISSLYDESARRELGRGMAFEAVIGTDEDQVAVAPGLLRREWTEGGRRWFHYATDAPIRGEWTIASARYAVREERWGDVAIRVAHDPRHVRTLDGMVRGIRASLEIYTREFGPYPFGHLTFLERPGAGVGMHADASVISYTEANALWKPSEGPGRLDFAFAVVAHEMGHQWGVPYAVVEGIPVMAEGLAWYYAMQAVEDANGAEQLWRLRRFMREPYPHKPIRRGEPLLRGLDPYMAYRRAPFALYALSRYVGRPQVNGALRRLREVHGAPGAPPATTLDLYRDLQAVTPDSLRYLLHDLFEVNTYWGLGTASATKVRTPEGAWRVTLDLRARKSVYDSAGVESAVPMDEWVEVGVFGPRPQGKPRGEPLHLSRHRIRDGAQTVVVTVPSEPASAGIDPDFLLIDPDPGDNVREVTAAAP